MYVEFNKLALFKPELYPNKACRTTTDSSGYWIRSVSTSSCSVRYVYSYLVVIILWLNVGRMSTMFTPIDVFNAYLLAKLVTYVWVIMCTCMHTTFFLACRSGRLAKILDVLAQRAGRYSSSDITNDVAFKLDNDVTEVKNGSPIYNVSRRVSSIPTNQKLSTEGNNKTQTCSSR